MLIVLFSIHDNCCFYCIWVEIPALLVILIGLISQVISCFLWEQHSESVSCLQLSECVQRGVSLLVRDAEGCSALHIAAQNGHTDLVRYILQQGGKRLKQTLRNGADRKQSSAEDECLFYLLLFWNRLTICSLIQTDAKRSKVKPQRFSHFLFCFSLGSKVLLDLTDREKYVRFLWLLLFLNWIGCWNKEKPHSFTALKTQKWPSETGTNQTNMFVTFDSRYTFFKNCGM